MKKPMFLIAVLVAGLLAVALIGGAIAAPDTEQAKLTASDAAAGDQFGFSVAISGETAVVGASSVGSTGSAYVFVLDGGTWVQQAKLTASDAATGDEFGWSVAISGETIVVGARSDTTTAAGSGSAYVFVRTGSTWSQQAHLTAGDAGRGDSFGSSVAISDDTIVAGAPSDDDGGFNSGSAYVFVRTGSTWNQQDKLRASDATAGDRFAGSVAVSGDTAVTGAVQDDYQGTLTGSAYVFVRSGTTWTEEAKLTASDAAALDAFGNSVAVSEDTVVIGANGDNTPVVETGSTYVFLRSDGVWSQQAKLIANDADNFGRSVSVSGDTAVIGAETSIGGGGRSGSAYAFVRNDSTWSLQAKLTASDAAHDDRFGASVAVSGNTTVVGAHLHDDIGSNSGSAYVFGPAAPTDAIPPAVTITTPFTGATYDQGQSVQAAYTCDDEAGGSGIGSCAGTVAVGADIDTTNLGAHSFTVTGTDNAGNQTAVTHSYTVVEPIVALDDSATTTETTPIDVDVLLNDIDPVGGPLTAVVVREPFNGTVSNNLSGTIRYSPGTGITERVSVSSSGAEGAARSQQATLSADGRFVAFSSLSPNLVPNDTNGLVDVFVHDRLTGATELISVKDDGTQGNGLSHHPRFSLDGRFIVFESDASNLVDGDTNITTDVFLRDRQAGTIERVSVGDFGTQGNGPSIRANVSADGRFIGFGSGSSNLVSGDTNNTLDIFIHDRLTGLTERISVDSDGLQGDKASFGIQMSADANVIVFLSNATDLIVGDTNGSTDVFVHYPPSGVTERVSLHTDGSQSIGLSGRNRISADGRFAVFESTASDLVTGDSNGEMDVFVRDLELRVTELISLASDGQQGNGESSRSSLSADGRFVAFSSHASNLVPGDSNDALDAFIHDRHTGITERISVGNLGSEGNGQLTRVGYNGISTDGRFVAFISDSSNLVTGDSNGVRDIFVRDRESNFVGVDTFTYVATDGTRDSNLATVTVTVGSADNEGPITSDVLASPNPAAVDTEISLTASVDDSATGGSPIESVEFGIDDPEFLFGSAMTDDGGAFGSTISPFAEAGVHEICVRGIDSAGNIGAAECILLAVYDPDGGYVTGGGWIVSPPDAYVGNPSLTGKANFGFVSKYKKEANVPTGQTEFQFNLADLNFHSTSYQFLVLAGAKAIFKGDGTIGGGGDYGFMITALDERLTPRSDLDMFRIKIWDKNVGDAVVYDNGLGSDENSDPTTELGGGNIVIHKK